MNGQGHEFQLGFVLLVIAASSGLLCTGHEWLLLTSSSSLCFHTLIYLSFVVNLFDDRFSKLVWGHLHSSIYHQMTYIKM